MISTSRFQSDPLLRERLDPRFWHPAYDGLLADCRYRLTPLGQHIEHIAYGPIVTGREPPPAEREGVAIVHQGQLTFTGVDLSEAIIIPPGCDWDRPNARTQPGDLLIARSGSGSLGRNRVCVFEQELAAVVGSFVDVVRLRGIDSLYVAAFLRTGLGWGQIFRIVNGVGTPNISFDEIAGLLVPEAPAAVQWRVHHRFSLEVAPSHRAYVERKLRGLARGLPSDQASKVPEARIARRQAVEAYRALLNDLERHLRGQADEL